MESKSTTGVTTLIKTKIFIRIPEGKAGIPLNTLLHGLVPQIPGKLRNSRHFPHMPKNYDASSLSMNIRPENKKSDIDFAPMTAPYWTPEADVAHEVIILKRLIMNLKIMISKPSLFLFSILERKDQLLNGFLLVFFLLFSFSMNS